MRKVNREFLGALKGALEVRWVMGVFGAVFWDVFGEVCRALLLGVGLGWFLVRVCWCWCVLVVFVLVVGFVRVSLALSMYVVIGYYV